MIAWLRHRGKGELIALHHQHLTGERETDAGAVVLGGVEGNEEIAVMIRGDRGSVVADV